MTNALAEWMESQIGPRRRFRSYREWSIKAELNPSRAGQVAEQGTATPETLIALGRAAGTSPEEMFILAGWLQPHSGQMPAGERAWLAVYQSLDARPDLQAALQAGAEGIARGLQELEAAAAQPGPREPLHQATGHSAPARANQR